MQDKLIERIKGRLEAVGLNSFEAARRINSERGYVNDIITGRKKTIAGDKLIALAKELDCDPEFLVGAQDVLRRGGPEAALAVTATITTGLWMTEERVPDFPSTIAADPRYPPEQQKAYLVQSDIGNGTIFEGSVVITVPLCDAHVGAGALLDGDLVVCECRRGEEKARAIRRVKRGIDGVSLIPLGTGSRTIRWKDREHAIDTSDGLDAAEGVTRHLVGVIARVVHILR